MHASHNQCPATQILCRLAHDEQRTSGVSILIVATSPSDNADSNSKRTSARRHINYAFR